MNYKLVDYINNDIINIIQRYLLPKNIKKSYLTNIYYQYKYFQLKKYAKYYDIKLTIFLLYGDYFLAYEKIADGCENINVKIMEKNNKFYYFFPLSFITPTLQDKKEINKIIHDKYDQ